MASDIRRGLRFLPEVGLQEALAMAERYTERHNRPHHVMRRDGRLWLVCDNWLARNRKPGDEVFG